MLEYSKLFLESGSAGATSMETIASFFNCPPGATFKKTVFFPLPFRQLKFCASYSVKPVHT
jgi:hypothetical protein